jgi:P27 family predicted phage terminase small subunit
MTTVGRKPKPHLQAVKEGNPGQRKLDPGMTLPPSDLAEPDWDEWFPGGAADLVRARSTAARLWAQLAVTLARSAGLVREQQETLVEYCVTYARIEQGERALSEQGVVVMTERGQVKNAWTSILNGYRAHMRSLIGELGLSPSAATRITRPPSDDEDDPFD